MADGRDVSTALAGVRALLTDAAAHYRIALHSCPDAVEYLQYRGIGDAVAARFGLGYARPTWRDLGDVFRRHGDDAVSSSGLVISTGKGEQVQHYDRFRSRLIFPIRTCEGDIAGFGGRILDGGEPPKYINSPEGAGFKKRELLYGLYEAQSAIQAENMALVVEGYLDVLTLAQAGFGPVVATLGTACSATQISHLLTMTHRVVFCFDGDAAGRRAAARALETILPYATDMNSIAFVFLPTDHDPDSFVRSLGVELLRTEIAAALPLNAFLLQRITDGAELRYAEGRALCVARARPLWLAMPDGQARDYLLRYCAGLLKFDIEDVRGMWLK
ncbi:DNA primase [Rhodoferax sp.]|uniref:DNA primase n=1 Tax=Rhodoferax sp. TaxID=50421 RepID=UPI0027463882|nr:toprim domain-containing protein [Rhodoferax sp.]